MEQIWLSGNQTRSSHLSQSDALQGTALGGRGEGRPEGAPATAWTPTSLLDADALYSSSANFRHTDSTAQYSQPKLSSGMTAFAFDQQSSGTSGAPSATAEATHESFGTDSAVHGSAQSFKHETYSMGLSELHDMLQRSTDSEEQKLSHGFAVSGPAVSTAYSAPGMHVSQPAFASFPDLTSSFPMQGPTSSFAFPTTTAQVPSSFYGFGSSDIFSQAQQHPPQQSHPYSQGMPQSTISSSIPFSGAGIFASTLPRTATHISGISRSPPQPLYQPLPSATIAGLASPPAPNANALQAHIFNLERVANLQRQITDMQTVIRGLQHQQQMEGPASGQAHDRAASIAHLMRECDGYK